MAPEQKQHLIALMAFSGVFFLMLAPVLFFGQAFGQSDISGALYPILSFFQRSLTRGQSLLWSINVFSGFPLFILGNYFNPFYFLTAYIKVFPLYHWMTFGNAVAAAFLTYYFLRRRSFEYAPAVVGGLLYVGGMWTWIADMSLSAALPVLPAIFLLLTTRHETISWWRVVFGAVVIGYSVYAVNFNLLPLVLLATGAYTVFVSIGKGREQNWRQTVRLPAKFFFMAAAGGVMGLPQLFATARFAALSARAGRLGFVAASEGAVKFFDVVKLLAPYAQLPLMTSENFMFLGAFGLLLVAAGLLYPIRHEDDRPHGQDRQFFLWMLLVSLLVAVKYSPLFWIISKLPLLGSLRAPGRWLWLAVFAASCLASYGLEVLTGLRGDERLLRLMRGWRWLVVVWAGVTGFVTVVFLTVRRPLLDAAEDLFVSHFYRGTTQLPLEHYYRVIERMLNDFFASFNLLNPAVSLPALFLVASALVLQAYSRKRISQSYFLLICTVGAALNFMLVLTPYHSTVAQALFDRESEVVTYLKQHPGKFLALLPGLSEYQLLSVPYNPNARDALEFQLAQLPPNYSLLYDLESADYYNNLMSRRMAKLLALIGSDRATAGDKLSEEKIPIEEKVKKFEQRKNILDLLGIRYVISAYPLDEQKFVKVSQTSLTRFNIPVYLYENPDVRPVVYLADETRIINESEEESYKEAINAILGNRSVVVECEHCNATTGQARGHATVKAQKNGKWRIDVTTPDDRWLIISENYLPGWNARLDGKETAIHFANSTFMAVFVPAGKHEVSFDYTYPARFPLSRE